MSDRNPVLTNDRIPQQLYDSPRTRVYRGIAQTTQQPVTGYPQSSAKPLPQLQGVSPVSQPVYDDRLPPRPPGDRSTPGTRTSQ